MGRSDTKADHENPDGPSNYKTAHAPSDHEKAYTRTDHEEANNQGADQRVPPASALHSATYA